MPKANLNFLQSHALTQNNNHYVKKFNAFFLLITVHPSPRFSDTLNPQLTFTSAHHETLKKTKKRYCYQISFKKHFAGMQYITPMGLKIIHRP